MMNSETAQQIIKIHNTLNLSIEAEHDCRNLDEQLINFQKEYKCL